MTTSPFLNPPPRTACSSRVTGSSELTRMVDLSTSNRRPTTTPSSGAWSLRSHSSPETKDVSAGMATGYTLDPGFVGEETVTYEVCAAGLRADTATVSIVVTDN